MVVSKTKKIVLSALITALTFVATMVIKVPSPLNGYLNLGDCIVLVAGWLLGPWYGLVAAGLGSALADLLSGYLIYAPATFVIKSTMAVVCYFLHRLLKNKLGSFFSHLISGVIAEIVMVAGYFVFEGFMYGFIPSLVNVIPNCVQGAFGVVIGIILIKVIEKIMKSTSAEK